MLTNTSLEYPAAHIPGMDTKDQRDKDTQTIVDKLTVQYPWVLWIIAIVGVISIIRTFW